MKKSITLVLTLVLALVNISTASAASIKGQKLSFTTGWNASMQVPATETRVYVFGNQWESASTSLSNIDTEVYKSFTVDCEATEGAWFNMPVTDGNGNAHYPGFAGDGKRGLHTITFAEVDGGLTGPLSGMGVQNCSETGTITKLTIYNAYLTKQNGATEGVIMSSAMWGGNSSFNYANPITSAPVHFAGQWGSATLYGANNIECGVKIRLYTKNVISYDDIQLCVKFADDNSDGWPQFTKITDTYAECVVDRPTSNLALQWRGTTAGDLDIEAITYERLDGQGADEEEGDVEYTSFHKLTDVKAVPGIKSFSSEVLRGYDHNTAYAPASTVKFYAEEGKDAPKSILVAIKKFDGTKVCLATVKTLDDLLVVEAEKALEEGDYMITIAPYTLVVDDQLCDEEMSFVVAALDASNTAVEEAKLAVQAGIDEINDLKEYLIYGVNVFQYAPGVKDQIAKATEEAEYYKDLYAEEVDVYNVLIDLNKYVKGLRSNLPKANSKYLIKHKATGLYLNMDGDKVTLQAEATPIQFHLVEPSEGMYDETWRGWDQYNYTTHFAYIYNTADRDYLGYEEGKSFVATNKQNTVWYVDCESTNEYYIEIAYPYEGRYYNDLTAAANSKAGAAVTLADDWAWGDAGSVWFIENYIEPETAEPSTGGNASSEEATAINSTSATVAPAAIFNANGARVNAMQKGVNIVKMTDGTVRKVIVK